MMDSSFFSGIMLMSVMCSITESDALCDPASRGVKRFGSDCNFRCHCFNYEQCTETGTCTSGCDYYWTGPSCQFKNIALYGDSRHSDNRYYSNHKYSDLANDRDVGTCSYTMEVRVKKTVSPWWALWFTHNVIFKDIMLMTLDSHLKYFPGFNVTVQQEVFETDHTQKKYLDGELCYQRDSSIPKNRIVHVSCTKYLSGNQIRIQLANTSTQLVICDFRVYGECKDRSWGSSCQNTCGFCNTLSQCRTTDGYCSSGCEKGYKKTPNCTTECDNGTYGRDCLDKCNKNCRDNLCHKENGMCTHGCYPGYTGQMCKQECEAGKYGLDCTKICSANCASICNYVNGTCFTCKPGWKGDNCTTECDNGTYGRNCSDKCDENCRDNLCHKENGTCTHGCYPGYTGQKCEHECKAGKFGLDCKRNCSAYCDSNCDNVHGTCFPCKSGWKGDNCTTGCESREWGVNCSKDCGSCLEETCNRFHGKCNKGCMPGFKNTKMCIDECYDGTYGDNCTLQCGSCYKTSMCHKATGVCLGGCLEGYTGNMCVEEKRKSFPIAVVAGGLSGAIALIVLVAAGLLIHRRKRQNTCKRNETSISSNTGNTFDTVVFKDDRCKKEALKRQNDYSNTSTLDRKLHDDYLGFAEGSASGGNECEYMNDTLPTHKTTGHEILISELKAYVKTGLATKDYFVDQFSEIPYGMQYPYTVATKPANCGKNKYKLMYAYDHSRVVLKTIPGQADSDYINATYIQKNEMPEKFNPRELDQYCHGLKHVRGISVFYLQGYTCANAYIAAQGPIVNTLQDFWRMIWENKIRTIVMATNLSEEGKSKCVQYWPEVNQSVQNGKFIVFMESEDIFTEFTVRRLKVSHEGKPERRRSVTQFHYTAWPDKDVPRCTSSLLHFWYQVRKYDDKQTSPWLVHCSAGVGRTGTFIALDILYDQGKNDCYVDVYQCVLELRGQRVNMVQTKDQYKFLHNIMVEALVLPWKPVHVDEFCRVYAELKEIDQRIGKTRLLSQYESINDGSDEGNAIDTQDDTYASAKKTENRHRNRYDNILAPNEFRPFLYTNVIGCTDYINAVYIPGYRTKHGYIITQTPLTNTAVDCCRLIFEDDVRVIVTFEDHGDEEVGEYLPETGAVKIGPFSIVLVAEEDMNHFMIRSYDMKFQAQKRTVTQLIFKKWLPSRLTPSNPNEMHRFMQELEQLQRQTDSKPVLIHCLNGAERSGLVVVLMNILERVIFDNEISITQVIRQLKVRRQQIVPNFEQFKFCHEVLLSHIQCNSTYANM